MKLACDVNVGWGLSPQGWASDFGLQTPKLRSKGRALQFRSLKSDVRSPSPQIHGDRPQLKRR